MRFSVSFITHCKSFRSYLGLSVLAFFPLIMISGCAVERNVKDNRFYSSHPPLTTDISKEFVFLGSDKCTLQYKEPDDFWSMSDENYEWYRKEFNYYFFVPQNNKEQIIRRGVIVRIITPDLRDSRSNKITIHFKMKDTNTNILGKGAKLNNGQSAQYFTQVLSRYWGNPMMQWLKQKGYIYPTCSVEQHIYGDVSYGKIKEIIYFEDASSSGINCWHNKMFDKSTLTDKQRKNIGEFMSRADRAVQLIEF
jgi:hypothetical protein